MVTFRLTAGGFDVLVDEKLFGRLQKGDGFFTDSTVVKTFLIVSPEELREIALKAEAVKAGKETCCCRPGLRSTHCPYHGTCNCCHGASCPTHDEPERLVPV